MCKPKYFDVIHYKLNSHMLMQQKVNYDRSYIQWRNLESNLLCQGVKINYIKPQKTLVDMVFAANGGIIYNNKAIVSNFNAIPRKKESEHYNKFFNENGYDTYNMVTEFEGAGDGLFSHNKEHLWLGYGFRSNKDSKNEIEDIISNNHLEIHTLQLTNPLWYHLDTCFCPFGEDRLILYEKAFDKNSLKKIYNVFDEKKCIKVSDEDAENFACNSIPIPNNIIIGHSFSPELKNKFRDIDYIGIETLMTEFLLSGGSTKCCVLNIDKHLKQSDNDNEEFIYDCEDHIYYQNNKYLNI